MHGHRETIYLHPRGYERERCANYKTKDFARSHTCVLGLIQGSSSERCIAAANAAATAAGPSRSPSTSAAVSDAASLATMSPERLSSG